MTPMEIVFLILGIGLIVISCFLTKDKETNTDVMQFSDEILEFQKKEAEKLVQQIFEEKIEEAVVKADDYLSKVSNEKIIAVNEFTDQILERIDSNHKEVVFLYDMLNQKEDEIKQIVQKFEYEKQQMSETVEEVSKLAKQLNTKLKKSDGTTKTSSAGTKRAETKKKEVPEKKETVLPANTAESRNGQMEFTEMLNQDTQKEEILRLYKQGKSILEISKSLGMGQGEVKLIIGLYGL
ncbi:MAG: hypothetical protein E7260_01075 [Lachnospiraceae bacterium]|nr:hypothetical protein [Lachnospiraceae bacterium]